MKFDYTLGKEATFQDWVDDGCKKAEAILENIDLYFQGFAPQIG